MGIETVELSGNQLILGGKNPGELYNSASKGLQLFSETNPDLKLHFINPEEYSPNKNKYKMNIYKTINYKEGESKDIKDLGEIVMEVNSLGLTLSIKPKKDYYIKDKKNVMNRIEKYFSNIVDS